MKHIKHLSFALLLSTLSLQATCKIFTSPATNFSTLKGSASIALSILGIYYKKNAQGKKQMEIKGGNEALLEFDRKAREYLQKECQSNGWKTVYNFQIRNMGRKNWFDLYATYDYE